MDVLIVDDNPEVSGVLARVLERAGYTVKTADNGLAAFSELQQTPYAVIVLDILMPFLEGKSFFRQIEADFPNMSKRVLFVTGMADDEETMDFIARTGQPCLAKPVDAEEFVEAVRGLAGE